MLGQFAGGPDDDQGVAGFDSRLKRGSGVERDLMREIGVVEIARRFQMQLASANQKHGRPAAKSARAVNKGVRPLALVFEMAQAAGDLVEPLDQLAAGDSGGVLDFFRARFEFITMLFFESRG